MLSPLIRELITSLRCLPGVGSRTAQRMALYLLERDREGATALSTSIQRAVDGVGRCEVCRILSESNKCPICSRTDRNTALLCVVENPADVMALEQTKEYSGLYYVLKGHLSPLDGIGPSDIGIDILIERTGTNKIEEVILATNPTVEGEATAHYIAEILSRQGVLVSRLAHGVPLGGELEYIDGGTLARALSGRTRVLT